MVLSDLEVLISTRIEVLRAANKLDDTVDMSKVAAESRTYYLESLENGSHVAYLVYDGQQVVGAGGISFYKVMPTFHNPSGVKGYIMNMYTRPDYRRKGIAFKTLDLLMKEAKNQGIYLVTLEATDAGRLLYQKYGFVQMDAEMEYLWK